MIGVDALIISGFVFNIMKKSIPLKEIVGFLPYGLKAKLSIEGVFNLDSEYPNEHAHKLCTITDFTTFSQDLGGIMTVDECNNYAFDFDLLSEIIICVRPLSYLTKEITHNGETFVPIVELFKIAINVTDPNFKVKELKIEDGFYLLVALDNKKQEIVFGFEEKDKSFGIFYENQTYSVFNQYELFEKMHEYLIDFKGWIKDGLAIDINTL